MSGEMPPTYNRQAVIHDAGPLGLLEGLELTKIDNGSSSPLIRYFGGIPYALPPISEFRFRAPRTLPPAYRYGTKSNPGRFTGACGVCPQPGWRSSAQPGSWDENCLQLNIYIPQGNQPSGGWPVFFFIHGGFLQWGNPNDPPEAIAPLLSETAFHAIIVMPAYRLNAFGFLSSRELLAEARRNNEPVGNLGFWDQRLALEWVGHNIHHFGGDASNITIGGYSAGSHSAFQQLAHELYFVPNDQALIKRAIMWSNSPGVQPRNLTESQKQFDQVLTALNIPLHIPAEQKLARLRSIPTQDLVRVQDEIDITEFRALSDGRFVALDLISNINNGDFARRMKSRGIQLMNGECRDEHHLYRAWRTPQNSFQAMHTRLCADYPRSAVDKLCAFYCGNRRKLPPQYKDWVDLFGHLYAKMQVHCLERGFHDALAKGGLIHGKDVLRYRIEWRVSGIDDAYPPEWEVTHGTDISIWFWGRSHALTEDEERVLKPWNKAFADFVMTGDTTEWKTAHGNVKHVKRLSASTETDTWEDDAWEEGISLWKALNDQSLNELKAKI